MYDIVIIGKGPAGISASLYTSRAGINTLIIGKTSSLHKSHMVDNYYGFDKGITGDELLRNGERQTVRFGTQILEDEVIALLYDFEGTFTIKTKDNRLFNSRAVLLATGSEKVRIPIRNIEKFEGKGVHYCTTCDGYFYRDKKVAILGYNEYALNELEEMKQFTKDITILTNGNTTEVGFDVPLRVKKINSIEGGDYLDGIVYDDGSYENFDGIFVAYGTASSVDFARKLGIIINGNIIEVDENQMTNLEGLYAAGDCASKIKQVAVSVGQGALAGLKISEYIRNLGGNKDGGEKYSDPDR